VTRRRSDVPDIVASRAAVEGDGGAAWVAALPDVLAGLEEAWSIQVGEPLRGGTASYTARAHSVAGTPAVLKIAVPDPFFGRQVRTLLAAQGRGYVKVLAHDVSRHAVLLEPLGPSLGRCGLTPEWQLTVLADTLRLAWTVPPTAGPDGEAIDKARSLAEMVAHRWEELGRPCPERVVAEALVCADRRTGAFDPERCVVVHGDAAPPNLLRVAVSRPGAETGFVFVDPDGFVGDPVYDLGVALRDWSRQLLDGDPVAVARGYCRLLAARSGMDQAAIWEWGFLERVSTGLYALSLDAQDLARPLLTTAAALVDGEVRLT
jgi:streptomycin 6-kinase